MVYDYFRKHEDFITKICLEEIIDAVNLADILPEVRQYLGGLPRFIFETMHMQYLKQYFTMEKVQDAYRSMSTEEQKKDILRVIEFYKEERMKLWNEKKEKEKIKLFN